MVLEGQFKNPMTVLAALQVYCIWNTVMLVALHDIKARLLSLQALRVSMEEQRARQEAEARNAVSETPGADAPASQMGAYYSVSSAYTHSFILQFLLLVY